jgi:hypothetical protein
MSSSFIFEHLLRGPKEDVSGILIKADSEYRCLQVEWRPMFHYFKNSVPEVDVNVGMIGRAGLREYLPREYLGLTSLTADDAHFADEDGGGETRD